MPIIRNIAVFQGLWFALVYFGDWMLAPAMLWFSWHIYQYSTPMECRAIPIWIIGGLMMDQILSLLGILNYHEQTTAAIPLWMIGMWLAFSTTLAHGFHWVWSQSPIWLLIGSIAAGATYVLGAQFAPLSIPFGIWPTLAILTACWLLYFSFVRYVAFRST
ncbi:DUF2878 domain-containing protein [Litorivicinus sp.]|jgi:hypothetical protein|nr:DUF2878 domain-containing protein [Litorivicinus sp.]|tara:strand:- start:2405 stop:2887 length:483 start_codon:yes stop_codon:yes gene_type:complete